MHGGRCVRCKESHVVGNGEPDEFYFIAGVISGIRIDCIFRVMIYSEREWFDVFNRQRNGHRGGTGTAN